MIRRLVEEENIKIVGAVYDIRSGKVRFLIGLRHVMPVGNLAT